MKFRVLALAVIAGLSFALSQSAQAAAFYYNVDSGTGGGPVVFNLTSTIYSGGAWNVNATAQNTHGSLTFNNARYLLQFHYNNDLTPMSYSGGTWTGASTNLTAASVTGTMSMSQTDAPLAWNIGGGNATLTSGDTVAYETIGDGILLPGEIDSFSFQLVAPNNTTFQEVGSFVSTTPLPEPSTIVMFGLGGVALFAVRRRRK